MRKMLDLISLCGRGRPHFIRFRLFQCLKEFPRRCRQIGAAILLLLPASCHGLLYLALSHLQLLPMSLSKQGGICQSAHSFYIWEELMNQPSLSSHLYQVRWRGSEGVDNPGFPILLYLLFYLITTIYVNHTFPEHHDCMKSKMAEKIIWGYSSTNLSHADSASDRAERGNALVLM